MVYDPDMAENWIPGDAIVRKAGGRDHEPPRQEPRRRLSDEEVRARRAEAAGKDWDRTLSQLDRQERERERRQQEAKRRLGKRKMPRFR